MHIINIRFRAAVIFLSKHLIATSGSLVIPEAEFCLGRKRRGCG